MLPSLTLRYCLSALQEQESHALRVCESCLDDLCATVDGSDCHHSRVDHLLPPSVTATKAGNPYPCCNMIITPHPSMLPVAKTKLSETLLIVLKKRTPNRRPPKARAMVEQFTIRAVSA